jgi:hypothetical protein
MQQRQLRLGDILDDYCPRERRITNHAVVAMIEDEVKQTRCTTCDAEHVYKGAKVPQRRRKTATGALYKTVLAGMPDPTATPSRNAAPVDADADTDADAETEAPAVEEQPAQNDVRAAAPQAPPAPPSEAAKDTPEPSLEDGPVHRPLIRATLPRLEGHAAARPVPEFTVRRNNGRNGSFRPNVGRPPMRGGQPGDRQGGRPNVGGRFSGSRPPSGSGGGRPAQFAQRSGQHSSSRPPQGRPRNSRPQNTRHGNKRSK